MGDTAFVPSMVVRGAAGHALRIPTRDYTVAEAVDCWTLHLDERPTLRYQLACVTTARRGFYGVSLWETDTALAGGLLRAGLDEGMASHPRDLVVLELKSHAMGRYVTRAVANMVARGVLVIHDGHEACEHWSQALELIAALKTWETSGLT